MNSKFKSSISTGYLAAMLWASSDDNGEPLDSNYSIDDVSSDLKKQSIADIEKFVQSCETFDIDLSQFDAEQIGHDFWLTRNGHGSGFWARPEIYGEDTCIQLTNIAECFDMQHPYIGDDSKIHLL